METLTIILNSAPYGDEKVYNALRMTKALLSAAGEIKVNIFLLGDAVTAVKKGQKTPEGFYNVEVMLKDLIDHGVSVHACRTCATARGLTEQDFIEGAKIGTLISLAHWVEESQKILSF